MGDLQHPNNVYSHVDQYDPVELRSSVAIARPTPALSSCLLRSPQIYEFAIELEHIIPRPTTPTPPPPREYEDVMPRPLPQQPVPSPDAAERARAKYFDKWHRVLFAVFQWIPTGTAFFELGPQWGILIGLSLRSSLPWFPYHFLNVLGTIIFFVMAGCLLVKKPDSGLGEKWTSKLLYPGVIPLLFLALLTIFAKYIIELKLCLYSASVINNSESLKIALSSNGSTGYNDSFLVDTNWTSTITSSFDINSTIYKTETSNTFYWD